MERIICKLDPSKQNHQQPGGIFQANSLPTHRTLGASLTPTDNTSNNCWRVMLHFHSYKTIQMFLTIRSQKHVYDILRHGNNKNIFKSEQDPGRRQNPDDTYTEWWRETETYPSSYSGSHFHFYFWFHFRAATNFIGGICSTLSKIIVNFLTKTNYPSLQLTHNA